MVKYCNRKCQVADWKLHKTFCSNFPDNINKTVYGPLYNAASKKGAQTLSLEYHMILFCALSGASTDYHIGEVCQALFDADQANLLLEFCGLFSDKQNETVTALGESLWFYTGLAYMKLNDNARVILHLKKALAFQDELYGEKSKRSAFSLYYIGLALSRQCKPDEALEYLRRCRLIQLKKEFTVDPTRDINTFIKKMQDMKEILAQGGPGVDATANLMQTSDCSKEDVLSNALQSLISGNVISQDAMESLLHVAGAQESAEPGSTPVEALAGLQQLNALMKSSKK